MHRLIVTLWALLLVPAGTAPAHAQTADTLSAGDRAAMVSVIERQLDAFQRDAAMEAFQYASPTIQRMFGDPATFMTMVRTGYAAIYRPQSVEFTEAAVTSRGPAQRVLLVGPDGRLVRATYFMQRQPDGSWRINGVTLDEAPGLSA